MYPIQTKTESTIPMPFIHDTPIRESWILDALESITGRPTSPEERHKYGACQTREQFWLMYCNDRINQLLLLGDKAIGTICEIDACLLSDIKWAPQEFFDGYGAMLMGYEVAGVRVHVKHSKITTRTKQWGFEAVNSNGEYHYDVMVCYGFNLPESETLRNVSDFPHINPCHAKLFVIPALDIATKTFTIQPRRMSDSNRNRRQQNQYWEYQVEPYDLKQRIAEIAHGVKVNLTGQVAFEFMEYSHA